MSNKKLSNIVAYADQDSQTTEAFRCLRTSVRAVSKSNNLKIVGVTSSTPNEGKTYVLANLAVVMAQLDKKILLIDADVRRSGLTKMFKISTNLKGLVDVLSSDKGIPEEIPFVKIGLENLTILPAGTQTKVPAELLSSATFNELIDSVRYKYDTIFIDLPPVLSVTDPVVVGRKIDGLLLVVRANKTAVKVVNKTYNTLKNADVNLIGTVLNGVQIGTGGYYSYGYYGDSKK